LHRLAEEEVREDALLRGWREEEGVEGREEGSGGGSKGWMRVGG
jgi:hypothetical protein